MALGKLSAGLAHELNNPAAAIVRGSVSLLKHLQLQPETFKELSSIKMDAEDVDKAKRICLFLTTIIYLAALFNFK